MQDMILFKNKEILDGAELVTKKKLHRYGIKIDDERLFCGEKDSIDDSFLNRQFVQIFVNNLIDWFNAANNSNFALATEDILFGIISGLCEKEILTWSSYLPLCLC